MWTEELKTAALAAGWGEAYGFWKGIPILKLPNDLLSIQEIIHDTDVDLLVETGTYKGGSAHYYADIGVDVISVDKAVAKDPPPHPKVEYIRGSSTSPRTLYLMYEACRDRRVMVLLDSDHSKANVTAELEAYASMVTEGCYLIVEDTALGRELRPTIHDDGDGPADALDDWLPDHPEFEVDLFRERWGPTMNPNGYLKRLWN